MAIDVTVLRVFTNATGDHGNPLGVVDAAQVAPPDRQALATELGYSETIFVDLPTATSASVAAHIFTPAVELPFAGHPTVGAAWWLRRRGNPVTTLRVPAGIVQVAYEDLDDGEFTVITARPAWAPEFVIHAMDSVDEVLTADPDDYDPDAPHYLWAWEDRASGAIRSRMFASHLGVREDEATGAAAVRITDHLSRDLAITQGKGSQIRTWWDPQGWVRVAGRVVDDGLRQVH